MVGPFLFAKLTLHIMESLLMEVKLMKTFIIVVETAFIAFMAGGIVGMQLGEQRAQQTKESSEEATPA